MHEDHPVLNSMLQQLRYLSEQYRRLPNDLNRYRLVRHERLIAQWAPNPAPLA